MTGIYITKAYKKKLAADVAKLEKSLPTINGDAYFSAYGTIETLKQLLASASVIESSVKAENIKFGIEILRRRRKEDYRPLLDELQFALINEKAKQERSDEQEG